MNIVEAQREMRSAFLGGFGGQLVAGVIWAASAAVGTWIGPAPGMATLFFGCMLLFPLTQLLLRGSAGRRRWARTTRSTGWPGRSPSRCR